MMDLTDLWAGNNFYEMVLALNNAGQGLPIPICILALYIVIMVAYAHKDFKAVFLTTNAITTIICILLVPLELMTIELAMIPTILLFVSIILYIWLN